MHSRAPHRRWSNRDVLREVDHGRAGWMWGLLLGLVVAAAPTGVYQHQQNECLKLDSEIQALQREKVRLHELQRRLTEQRAALESPAAVEHWSRQSGMVPPHPDQLVVVRPAPSERGNLVARMPSTSNSLA